ncbi:MAG: hypothetical protein VKQ33_09650 [Candidatus Sericytochromatia bacterium]|nr:hypothetical protein [Candidatus Sericytochromatia bacterium]
MTAPDTFVHLTVGSVPDASPTEVLAATEALLARASERAEATLVALDGSCSLGWHPLLGRFRLAARRPDAPEHLPAWLATLVEAPAVHASGSTWEEALQGVLALARQAVDAGA